VDNRADYYLNDLAKEIGYDGPVRLVTEEELDRAIAEGNRELYRGFVKQEHAEQFLNGAYFAGVGTYASGIQMAYGTQAPAIAARYAEGGPIYRMALVQDAKIGDFDDLYAKMKEEHQNEQATWQGTPEEWIHKEKILYDDPERYAAHYGYEAVIAPDFDYLIVLNRRKLKVQREPVK
jgi:hypothetical protein